jgi:hypothetical protein
LRPLLGRDCPWSSRESSSLSLKQTLSTRKTVNPASLTKQYKRRCSKMQKLDRLFISILQHQSVVTENLPIQMYLKILAAHSIPNLDHILMQQLRARSPRRPALRARTRAPASPTGQPRRAVRAPVCTRHSRRVPRQSTRALAPRPAAPAPAQLLDKHNT